MATYGPEQREVFFASTPLAFRSPMSPTLEAGASTRCLRIARGISGPEVDAAWIASGPAYLGATLCPRRARTRTAEGQSTQGQSTLDQSMPNVSIAIGSF